MNSAPTPAQLRSLGAQLAKFVRSSGAAPFSVGAMQGVVADLTADNSSLSLLLKHWRLSKGPAPTGFVTDQPGNVA
jgi:hypothetical protein